MPDNCEHWHGLIAERALHPLDPAQEAHVTAHLVTCNECRALAEEFAITAAALATTRPAPVTAPPLHDAPSAEHLYTQISTRIATERNRQRRRTWSTGLVATAAAALITVFAINIATSSTTSRTAGPHIALSNDAIDATAVLQQRPWGTQIHLEGQGFTPGQQYNVWLEQADGTHIPAGTFIGVTNTRITVTLASALPQAQAIAIGVSQPDGTLIVRAPLT